MKKIFLSTFLFSQLFFTAIAQQNNQLASSIAYFTNQIEVKQIAKDISQFRAKEFIINKIIGDTQGKEVKFETESLASDDSGGLISIAFNCDAKNQKGLLLAFFGPRANENGIVYNAYSFRVIPLQEAQNLLKRIEEVGERQKKYLSEDTNVNNVYIEHEDIKFVLYRTSGQSIRVFWNGFEVIWEDVAFKRTKRRLDKWFN